MADRAEFIIGRAFPRPDGQYVLYATSFETTSITVDALAPIVGLHSRLPGKARAKGILIFRANGARIIGAVRIPNRFARVRFVASAVVLGRHRRKLPSTRQSD
jgi:hypothetical protein